jgi:hypothetical protein
LQKTKFAGVCVSKLGGETSPNQEAASAGYGISGMGKVINNVHRVYYQVLIVSIYQVSCMVKMQYDLIYPRAACY